ncbi:MAG: DUF4445 domain-containing protein [Clostridiales bacterium]|nr:DUF4445 domain-containing protein [Clostridiales bacterium]
METGNMESNRNKVPEPVRILEEFHPCIEKEMVFRQIKCFPDSPVYEEMEDTFADMLEEMYGLCKPQGLMALGVIPKQYDPQGEGREREAIYILTTVGQEISDCSTQAFEQGDYVRGMLADAMADAALFSLEEDIQRELRTACGAWKLGIKRRLEAPHDVPMEIQKEALLQTRADEILGMELSEGYMFRPLKTSCQVYVTTADEKVFKSQHNCRKCPNLTCGLRNVQPLKIKVVPDNGAGEVREISLLTGTLLEALRSQMDGVQAPCGGRGFCGKCRVQVLEGELPVKPEDEKAFSEEELKEGWRLACQAVPEEDLTIRLGWGSESGMEVQSGFQVQLSEETITDGAKAEKWEGRNQEKKQEEQVSEQSKYGFAVDIGTTTLAIQLISLADGRCLDTYTGLNSQRVYGADVIARIQAAIDGKGKELQERICQELWKGAEKLRNKYGISWEDVTRIVIAGNTTMIHLLMGFPCDGLGSVPFTPYEIGKIEVEGKELFPEMGGRVTVQIYPGISTFVGADIVAGICAVHMGKGEHVNMLIDLGTNGEMALGNGERLLVTSTAAGPAFEGGNITWGTGSVPGAVCNVRFTEGKLEVKTIQNQPPVGICGTGVIELVSELVKNEEVDETGRLEDEWFENGYPVAVNPQGEQIVLVQKDIREIQLAKAAVRAGIETLLERYGITADQVHQVYVAGGFGYQLDYEKAMEIGMFPKEFEGKLQAVGNSSLHGAVELLIHPEKTKEAVEAAELAEEVSLSTDPVFQEAYMDAMFFEAE